MIRKLIQTALRRFDRRYGYDSSYLLDLYDASPGAFRRFSRLTAAASYRRKAPVDAYFAAKITAAMVEDCGPCAQLAVDMAEQAGVPTEQIRALIQADVDAMSSDVALGYQFACAVLPSGLTSGDPHAEVQARWGDGAVAELALCVTTARMFPQMKRGLGRAQACTRLRVGEATLEPSAPSSPGVHPTAPASA